MAQENEDLLYVDLLTPTFLFPPNKTRDDILQEGAERLGVEQSALKLYYLIDTESKEQQTYRMAVSIENTKMSLQYVEQLAKGSDLLKERLKVSGRALVELQKQLDEEVAKRKKLEEELAAKE